MLIYLLYIYIYIYIYIHGFGVISHKPKIWFQQQLGNRDIHAISGHRFRLWFRVGSLPRFLGWIIVGLFSPRCWSKKRSWSVHSGPKYKRCYILWWRSMSSSWSLGFSTDSKTHGICDFGCGGDGNGKDLNVISYHGRVRLKIFLIRITNCSVYIGNLFGFLEAYPSMIIQVFLHSSNSSNGDGDGDGDDVGWESTVVLTGDVSLNLWSRALLASSLDGSNLGD